MLRIGAAIIGATIGAFTLISLFSIWTSSHQVFVGAGIVGALLMAFLSVWQYDNIVIFGTATIGSYLFIRGFSLFLPGTFPSEGTLLDKFAEGTVPVSFYIYMAVLVIVVGLGVAYQKKRSLIESQFNFIKL